ncbi:zcchc10 protein [Anaeramoeba flamelloides]|uniref:Zcchc10 protein n=1 Tax=Anaeramoeba flamelloides TaxID=1746091 RepID=A0AAV8A1W1_9EUKA|nr:zcchc10 protein [Anaeramoeba flamelloides]
MSFKTIINRKPTKNQERVESLLKMKGDIVSGLLPIHLSQLNSPSVVSIHCKLIESMNKAGIKQKDLICFMFEKYNLNYGFKESVKTNDEQYADNKSKENYWDIYDTKTSHKTPSTFLKYSKSQAFVERLKTITKMLRENINKTPRVIKGLEIDHLEKDFVVPKQIEILKEGIKKLSSQSKSNQRVIERGFITFFNVRFNLLNHTDFDREKMIFGRNVSNQKTADTNSSSLSHSGECPSQESDSSSDSSAFASTQSSESNISNKSTTSNTSSSSVLTTSSKQKAKNKTEIVLNSNKNVVLKKKKKKKNHKKLDHFQHAKKNPTAKKLKTPPNQPNTFSEIENKFKIKTKNKLPKNRFKIVLKKKKSNKRKPNFKNYKFSHTKKRRAFSRTKKSLEKLEVELIEALIKLKQSNLPENLNIV